jgi:RimJ/RimL family protein N-acetyltransferase
MPDVNLSFPCFLPTRRILLRRLQQTDAQALCDYRSLPEVAVYQSWERFGLDEAAALLQQH